MAKHKFASISLTVRDRAISSKFSTHRVSKECTLCNFQKIFPSPKMAAILNFRIFAKNGKTQFYCVNISYLVDRCNSPAPSRSRQTLEKNVLSWALAWTGSVVFTRQVSPDTQLPYCACARMRTSSFCLAPLCLKS